MMAFSERFPWQASVLFTTLIYLGAAGIVWLLPCDSGFLIGFCAFSRLAITAIGALVYLAFLVLALAQRFLVRREAGAGRARAELNRRLFFQMLFFSLLAAAFFIFLLAGGGSPY